VSDLTIGHSAGRRRIAMGAAVASAALLLAACGSSSGSSTSSSPASSATGTTAATPLNAIFGPGGAAGGQNVTVGPNPPVVTAPGTPTAGPTPYPPLTPGPGGVASRISNRARTIRNFDVKDAFDIYGILSDYQSHADQHAHETPMVLNFHWSGNSAMEFAQIFEASERLSKFDIHIEIIR